MNFIVVWQFVGMGLFRMLFQVSLGGGLVTVLSQAHLMLMVLLLVGSMGLLVCVVAMSSSMLVGNLGKVVVNAVDLCTTVNKSHFAIGIVDQSIELVSLR